MYAENLKIAAYGATERGKTVGIAQLIKKYGQENVGIISCEHGLTSIASVVDESQVRVANDMAGLREAYGWASKAYPKANQWICVDGGSRVLQWIEQESWGGVEAAYEASLRGDVPLPLQQWLPFITKRDGINTQRVWSKVGSNAERLFNTFVRLPSSSYWTFWEQLTNIDQYTKGPPYTIDSPGEGTRKAVRGTFDFIYRLTRAASTVAGQPSEIVATFKDGGAQYAKSRADWNAGIRVPDEIKPFDLGNFAEMIRGR